MRNTTCYLGNASLVNLLPFPPTQKLFCRGVRSTYPPLQTDLPVPQTDSKSRQGSGRDWTNPKVHLHHYSSKASSAGSKVFPPHPPNPQPRFSPSALSACVRVSTNPPTSSLKFVPTLLPPLMKSVWASPLSPSSRGKPNQRVEEERS